MAELTSLNLEEIISQMGQVGERLANIGGAEGAAGNISICVRTPLDVSDLFPQMQWMDLPVTVPDLAGMMLVVSGSGCRLREIGDAPLANLACVVVEPGGKMGRMFTSPQRHFKRVTSEFNSHLAIHADHMHSDETVLHTVLHGQPVHITYLSHLKEYLDEKYLNRHLLRWQPETILNMPEGIGVLPFLLPGSAQLVVETKLSMREHRIIIWARHGLMARAENSVIHALDIIEYAETAAHYEHLNLTGGGKVKVSAGSRSLRSASGGISSRISFSA
ncbi:MAG: class II aldolase/adducin family protein [Anaerolineales bacterium]